MRRYIYKRSVSKNIEKDGQIYDNVIHKLHNYTYFYFELML